MREFGKLSAALEETKTLLVENFKVKIRTMQTSQRAIDDTFHLRLEECRAMVLREPRRDLSFGDSFVVASFNQQRYLLSLLLGNRRHGDKATLIYRGSKDGWGYADFHRCCDNKGATVTLFKTDKGRRFGGFS